MEACRECGTSLQPSGTADVDLADALSQTKARLVVTSAAGTFLILTALLWTCLRIAWDIATAGMEKPIGKPGVYGVGIMVFVGALPLLLPMAVIGLPAALAACVSRCRDGLLGTVAWLFTLLALAAVLLVRELNTLIPCVLLGKALHSSLAGYVGVAIQIAAGGILLGWFGRKRVDATILGRRRREESHSEK